MDRSSARQSLTNDCFSSSRTQMDRCTSEFLGIVGVSCRHVSRIELRSNSCVVASIPFVCSPLPRVYSRILTIRDDCDNVCNNEDNVAERHENVLDHLGLSSHHLR